MKRVLIIDEFPEEILKLEFDGLFEFDYQPKIQAYEVLEIIANYEGLILRSKMRLAEEHFSKSAKLEFVGRSGAGLENVDLVSAKKHGILIFNSPEGNRNAVAEHALGMILSFMNKLPSADAQVRSGNWDRESNWGTEIADKCLAVIGCGNMGSWFAQKVTPLFHRVLVYDKYKSDYAPEGCEEASLEEIFANADVVSLHTNLTDETREMVNAEFLNSFTKPILLVNTSRGQVVNTADLVGALKGGKLVGACLDVLEFEKLGFESLSAEDIPEELKYLYHSDKVLLSPHVAGWTYESALRMPTLLLEKIAQHYSS